MTKAANIVSRLRPAIAIALMLWCAGTGCVLVSYAHAAAMNGAETETAEAVTQSSDMAASHHECHAAHLQKNLKPTLSKFAAGDAIEQIGLPAPPSSSSMSCCPLASGSIATASRAQTNVDASVIATDSSHDLSFTNSHSAPLDVPLRLPNKAQTYLRGCVFLI